MSAGIKMESVLGHRLSVDTLAELAKIDTSGLVDGDIAFVKANVTYNAPANAEYLMYMLLKGSTKAAASPKFIDAAGGGVWCQMTFTPVP